MKILDIQNTLDYLNETEATALIINLIEASELYLKNATGIEYDENNPLAVLFCMTLVQDWYDNRTYMETGNVNPQIRPIIKSILAQLQYGD